MKRENMGAFTCRPPVVESGRQEFFWMVEAMNQELAENIRLRKGPRSKTALVVEMAKSRYAATLERKRRNHARIREDAGISPF